MSQTATYENTYWALAAEDVEYDFLYDGSEDSILFILEPDGTHTICQRLWQRLWPDLSDEHKALMITSLAQLTDERRWVVLGDEYGYGRNITARSVKSKHVAKIRIPDRPSKAFTAPKGKPENLPKAHKLRVRRKWARPRPKWKIDREMVRAAVKRERLLLALDRKRPVTYAAYTDENGNKVREPSEYRPRPAATKPRHPNYWVAYWEQWERRMNQLRRGSADPRGQVLKLREFIEDSARTSHYKKAGRDEMFWAGVFHRLMQQYDYACLDREGEVEPEEAKERYFDWTLPSDDGWGKVFVNTMSYVETYPVLHILTAFHEGGAEATLSAIECAGRRLKMYGDLKKAARSLMATKYEIVAERLPAATKWAVENFDGDILSFMRKVIGKLDAPARKEGRKAEEDLVNTECPERSGSLDAMKDAYNYEPGIAEGAYEGGGEEEPGVAGDVAAILAGRERYAELIALVREHLKGDQQKWALLKLAGGEDTEELCEVMGTTPDKLKRTAYAAKANLKKNNQARKLYDDPEFSDVARLMGGGIRVPHKAGRGKAPRDLRHGAKRTKRWPVVGYATEERLAKMGETVRLHRVRRRLRPAPAPTGKGVPRRDQRLVEYLTMWGGPQEDFETLGLYPTKWPLLDARDKRAVYDPDKGQTNAALFLQLMDKAKGRRFKRVGPLFGMNHRLKNDATKFKDYAVAEKELIEDGNYA